MRLAGLLVDVRCRHERVARLCADYRLRGDDPAMERPADIAVAVTQRDIDAERAGSGPGDWRDDYLETLAVYRRIADAAPAFGRMVFHGATVEYDGRAYVFTAPSGTGKTTQVRLWRSMLGDRVQVINGDKPLLAVSESGAVAYGTPWAGKEGWQRNVSAPVAGICVVRRAVGESDDEALAAAAMPSDAVRVTDDDGVENACGRLDAAEALPLVLRQTYMPADPAAALRVLGLEDALLRTVPVYMLSCTISKAAVYAGFEAMIGNIHAQNIE